MIIDGINSIASMLEIIKQPLFPRNIMTADSNGFFTVYNIGELFDKFERAQFRDCRISAYPPVIDKDVSKFVPNMLLLDLDLNHKIVNSKSKQAADIALKNRVNKLLAKLQHIYSIYNFMVLWTGNGRHVMIPFGFSRPFEYLTEFSKYLDLLSNTFSISEEFLVFAKKFLSDNQADPSNHPNFKSIFLRVPGTINTKRKYSNIPEIIKIEHEWEFQNNNLLDYPDLHPSTDLLYEYMGYLDDKAIAYRINQDQSKQSQSINNNNRNLIPWIETLWRTPVSDCRKRIIWLVLTRYAINRRNMSKHEALNWVKQWLIRCDKITSVDRITDDYIMYYLDSAKDSGYYPISFNTLKEYGWKMTDGIDLYNLIKNKMNQY